MLDIGRYLGRYLDKRAFLKRAGVLFAFLRVSKRDQKKK